MCIYCGTNNYRKIYENHRGPIPKDENGRTYDIHHIDGDRLNNIPENLVALTIKDHYDIHYRQGDYGSAWLIGRKIKMSPEELSNISRLSALKQIENGKSSFGKTGKDHNRYDATVRHFIHTNGEEFVGTQYELRTKFGLSQHQVSKLVNNPDKSVKGWQFFGKPLPKIGQPPDQKIYHFVNDDGRTFSGIKSDFRKKYDIHSGKLSKIINNQDYKSHIKGWRLVPSDY